MTYYARTRVTRYIGIARYARVETCLKKVLIFFTLDRDWYEIFIIFTLYLKTHINNHTLKNRK